MGESAEMDPALAADLTWGTAAGFGLLPVCRVPCGAGLAQLSLGSRAEASPGKLEVPFCFWKWLLHIPAGCIVGVTGRDRKRICALQTPVTGQELHVGAPNVILPRKS